MEASDGTQDPCRNASLATAVAALPLTYKERLECWAAALERVKHTRLNALMRTERLSRDDVLRARADNSPLSVAANDATLRIAGLKDDTSGEAMRFFELSEHDLRYIVCYCHWGETISAEQAALRVREVALGGWRRF